MILILDFGSQYTQLIARRIREQNVYCEIHPCSIDIGEIQSFEPEGIILSGGPSSVLGKLSPTVDKALFGLEIPILGICYGLQLIASILDGQFRIQITPNTAGQKSILNAKVISSIAFLQVNH